MGSPSLVLGYPSSQIQTAIDEYLDSFSKKSLSEKVKFLKELKDERNKMGENLRPAIHRANYVISTLESVLSRIIDDEVSSIDDNIKLMGSGFPLFTAFLERDREVCLLYKDAYLDKRNSDEKVEALTEKTDNNKQKDDLLDDGKNKGVETCTSAGLSVCMPGTNNSTEAVDPKDINGKEKEQPMLQSEKSIPPSHDSTEEFSSKIDNDKQKGKEPLNDDIIQSVKKKGTQSSAAMTMWKVSGLSLCTPGTKKSTEVIDPGYVRDVKGKERAQPDTDYLLRSEKTKKLKTSGDALMIIGKTGKEEGDDPSDDRAKESSSKTDNHKRKEMVYDDLRQSANDKETPSSAGRRLSLMKARKILGGTRAATPTATVENIRDNVEGKMKMGSAATATATPTSESREAANPVGSRATSNLDMQERRQYLRKIIGGTRASTATPTAEHIRDNAEGKMKMDSAATATPTSESREAANPGSSRATSNFGMQGGRRYLMKARGNLGGTRGFPH